MVERINDKAFDYVSTLSPSFQPAAESSLLERILAQRGRIDDFCVKAIKDLMELCIKDATIAKYVYNMQPFSFQTTRYCDWFKDYIEIQKDENEKNAANGYSYYKQRAEAAAKCYQVFTKFQAVINSFEAGNKAMIDEAIG